MGRRFVERQLVIASHNSGKVTEIAELLEPLPIEVTSAAKLGLDEPEETGSTFIANAELKAHAATRACSLPSLADDSGLVVLALAGAPGIYSARWAGPERDFSIAMQRVHEELGENTDRRAQFVVALSLAWPDGYCETVEGRVDGDLTWPPRGTLGFGYDPMFVPAGHDQTFGEMDPSKKHGMSHRADAFCKLLAACFDG